MRCKWLYLFFLILGFALDASYSLPASPPKESDNSDRRSGSDQSEHFKNWLEEDVKYIISEEEKKVFKDLQNDEEREKFVEQFWMRRDPDPRSYINSFKEEHYRRISYANDHFTSGIPGWRTDRGRIYIMYGQPDNIDSHPSGGAYNRPYWEGGGTTTTYPFETWWYRHIEGIGSDIEIEFVDPSMTGEYRMAMTPEEKDALIHVPNAGLTWAEEMGLSKKEDRPYFNAGSSDQYSMMRAKDQPFTRMEQFFNLQRPPKIKFEDLKSVVTTRITYNTLPFSVRTDLIKLSSEKVLVPVTLEVSNTDVEFKKQMEINRATVNVYGIVTNLTGRIMAEFEDTIVADFLDEHFQAAKNRRSEYQKIVALPPGQRYKLDLVVEDINSKNVGTLSLGINVPKYDGESLQSSTIILANSINQAPMSSNHLDQFVIGDLKVLPNVKSEYRVGDNLVPYIQIYNVAIDQTTNEPSLDVTFRIKKDGKIVEEFQDTAGNSIQLFSGERVVILGKIPLISIDPGKYSLEIAVQDNITRRSIVTSADFKVRELVQTTIAAAP